MNRLIAALAVVIVTTTGYVLYGSATAEYWVLDKRIWVCTDNNSKLPLLVPAEKLGPFVCTNYRLVRS